MFQKIFPKIYAFLSPNSGSNVYLIRDETLTLIDSSLSTNRELLSSSLKKLKILPQDISLILHTHGHADHFGCSYFFENADCRMHSPDLQYVNEKDKNFTYSSLLGETIFPKISSPFKENEALNLGKLSIKVLFTPGHTAGSVSFLEPVSKTLFSGDTIFNNAVGRTDLFSSNSNNLLSSLKNLLSLDFEHLLPGHGSLLTGLQENKKNIEKLLNFI